MIVTESYKLFGVLSELCKWSDVNNRIIRKVQIIQCNPLLTQFPWVMHAKGKESLAITRWKTEYIQISIYMYPYIHICIKQIFFCWQYFSSIAVHFIEDSFYLILIWILIGPSAIDSVTHSTSPNLLLCCFDPLCLGTSMHCNGTRMINHLCCSFIISESDCV